MKVKEVKEKASYDLSKKEFKIAKRISNNFKCCKCSGVNLIPLRKDSEGKFTNLDNFTSLDNGKSVDFVLSNIRFELEGILFLRYHYIMSFTCNHCNNIMDFELNEKEYNVLLKISPKTKEERKSLNFMIMITELFSF